MKVLVTRPASQATPWVTRLKGLGIDAVALPLIDIKPAPESLAVVLAWSRINTLRLIVFVSPNAVEHFFALKPAGLPWARVLQVASTGPGTTRALVAHGVPPERIIEPAADSAQFDSESLWERMSGMDWRGARALIVRGDGGRDWLADTLRAAGVQVDHVAAYRRSAPRFGAAEQALLQAATTAPQAHLWLFSSSEAIAHLAASVSHADLSRAWAIATHPRIAARAQELGFGNVVKTRPALDSVAACIKLMDR